MDALLTPLLESPKLIRIAEELQRLVQAEQAKREQFYDDISPSDKWEFINGEVIMHSPATNKHSLVRARIERVIFEYVDHGHLGAVLGEKTLVSFTRNDYEPDVIYFTKAIADRLKPDQWKYPIPNLIVEVLSPSTKRADRGVKKDDYAAHSVAEYWIVDPEKETIEQFLLSDGEYELAAKQSDGTFACRAIAGFVMPVRAAFDDDVNREVRRKFLAQ